MSYYDEDKPKNDFEKPKFTPYDRNEVARERGGCLSLFLVFVIAANVFFLFSYCAAASQASRYSDAGAAMPILAVAFAIQCAVIACAVATWNWQKWGYYGMIAAYALQFVMALCSGNLLTLGGGIIGLVIFLALTNDKQDMFE